MRTEKVISVVGGGGKTSYILQRAQKNKTKGKKTIVMTTTKMMLPEEEWPFVDGRKPNWERDAKKALGGESVVWIGIPLENGKMDSPPQQVIREILYWNVEVLVEADGAKQKPIKFPNEREPVLLPGTTDLVGVVGLDAVGRPLADCCHRCERAATCWNCDGQHIVTWQDICRLVQSEDGLKKGSTGEMTYQVLLNKADTEERVRVGEHIKEELEKAGYRQVFLARRGAVI